MAQLLAAFEPAIEMVPVETLQPYARNARTHSRKQIRQIAASIKEFGFVNPALIDADGRIIAGHGRVEAAKTLGLNLVPTIQLGHLGGAQRQAYALADNRLAELAGWDQGLLAIELQHLSTLDFDLEITGFETTEIDLMIESIEEQGDYDSADDVPELENEQPAVSRLGDLWHLGKHRLMCGDALDPSCYPRLMANAQARMVMTDPPYNVPVTGHVCGLGKIQHREFAMASGEMSESQFTGFLADALSNLAGHCLDGALLFIFMDWRHMFELLTAGRSTDLQLVNLCVWRKSNGGMGSLYRSQHELVAVFKSGTASHINNVNLGCHGRYRTNVWRYPGVNTLRQG